MLVMKSFFFIAMLVAMVAVRGAMTLGLVAMVKGGEFNEKYGNKMMRWRVYLKGLALAFFALALMSSGGE